jgi:hypothetical protein
MRKWTREGSGKMRKKKLLQVEGNIFPNSSCIVLASHIPLFQDRTSLQNFVTIVLSRFLSRVSQLYLMQEAG